jgi:hypothetical protein
MTGKQGGEAKWKIIGKDRGEGRMEDDSKPGRRRQNEG